MGLFFDEVCPGRGYIRLLPQDRIDSEFFRREECQKQGELCKQVANYILLQAASLLLFCEHGTDQSGQATEFLSIYPPSLSCSSHCYYAL